MHKQEHDVTDIKMRHRDDGGLLEMEATVDGVKTRYTSSDEGEAWHRAPLITAIITSEPGLKVEATITEDGAEVGLVTLTRIVKGGLPFALGRTWASPAVAMWVANQPNAAQAIWQIEAAVAECDGALAVS